MLSDFLSKDDDFNFFWRGYKFEVDRTVELTSLRGGAGGSNFSVALYELGGSGDEIGSLLASGSLESGTRGYEVTLPDPVQLSSDKQYSIAMGRDGGSGSFMLVSSIPDVAEGACNYLLAHPTRRPFQKTNKVCQNGTAPPVATLWSSGCAKEVTGLATRVALSSRTCF